MAWVGEQKTAIYVEKHANSAILGVKIRFMYK